MAAETNSFGGKARPLPAPVRPGRRRDAVVLDQPRCRQPRQHLPAAAVARRAAVVLGGRQVPGQLCAPVLGLQQHRRTGQRREACQRYAVRVRPGTAGMLGRAAARQPDRAEQREQVPADHRGALLGQVGPLPGRVLGGRRCRARGRPAGRTIALGRLTPAKIAEHRVDQRPVASAAQEVAGAERRQRLNPRLGAPAQMRVGATGLVLGDRRRARSERDHVRERLAARGRRSRSARSARRRCCRDLTSPGISLNIGAGIDALGLARRAPCPLVTPASEFA